MNRVNTVNKKSRGPSGAQILGSSPLGLTDNVLHALRTLRPCDCARIEEI